MSQSNKVPNQGPERPQERGDTTSPRRNSWIWVLLVVLVLYLIMSNVANVQGSGVVEVGYRTFMEQLDPRSVAAEGSAPASAQQRTNVKFIRQTEPGRFEATLLEPIDYSDPSVKDAKSVRASRIVVVVGDNTDSIITQMYQAANRVGVELKGDNGSGQILSVVLINLLPLVAIVLIFWFMASRVRKQMGAPGIFGKFGGNRAKRYEGGKTQVTFKDVAALRNVKRELQEIVAFLKHPERYTRLGAQIPKGVLLVGPPGTGKTLLARAVAGEAGVPFYSISGSEFIELFVGMGASRVRELFDEAKKNSPCIVFIDEIDAVGRSRGAGLGGGHDEREQTLNQILSEMDGFEITQTVIVLAATNRPDVLDPALVRPGRFDRQVVVERPQRDGRRQILEVHTKNIPLDSTVDLDSIARATIGFSGADLRNLANEAALLAARENKEVVGQVDFENAKDKILLGTLRDEAMTEKEKVLTAYHEAGHALLALLLPEADPVQSVTIVPRGRALGVTQQAPAEEIHSYSRTYLLNRVVIALGGRAAEELVFSEFTTGAENDLKQSTGLVERMVCRWGMSEKLGPVAFPRGEEHVFLGRELGETKHYSEHTAMLIDDEIRRIIDKCYTTAMELLQRERDKLERLAKELLDREILTDREIYDLLDMPIPAALREPETEVSVDRASRTPERTTSSEQQRDSRVEEGLDPGMLGLEGA
ncbi:MAG: ATP-dependent zinc metalloprotease FtsH [Planctomycetes bacterium]|nr:ATP-dependent zinc metalloprotease FtsH [Planctomycetota bacterium]